MPVYKRYIMPLKNAENGSSGGKCLIERLQDGKCRATVSLQGVKKTPLMLNIFDSNTRYCYKKPLRADKMGVIALRQFIDCDVCLEDLRCVCLLDSDEQPVYISNGNNFDWKAVIARQASDEKKDNIAESKNDLADIPSEEKNKQSPAEKPKQQEAVSDTVAVNKQNPHTVEENFKKQVKEMVLSFDQQLKQPPFQPFGNDDISWRKITLKDLSSDKVLWKYAGNPFVANGCKSYCYLLRGENEKFCFLAVPCTKQDRMKGNSQGFHSFAEAAGENGGACHCILKCEK